MGEGVDLEHQAAVALPAEVDRELPRPPARVELTVAHMAHARAGAEVQPTASGEPDQRSDRSVHMCLTEQAVLER